MINLPDGCFNDDDIRTYRYLANQVPQNGRMIELGVHHGKSLCSIADIIREKDMIVDAVDVFTPPDKAKEFFHRNIENFGIKVNLLVGLTSEMYCQFIDSCFDLVFIDADHRYEGFKSDIENYLPKVKTGGILAGHDYNLPDIKLALEEKFNNINHDQKIWWIIK